MAEFLGSPDILNVHIVLIVFEILTLCLVGFLIYLQPHRPHTTVESDSAFGLYQNQQTPRPHEIQRNLAHAIRAGLPQETVTSSSNELKSSPNNHSHPLEQASLFNGRIEHPQASSNNQTGLIKAIRLNHGTETIPLRDQAINHINSSFEVGPSRRNVVKRN
ncbi:hypothetical protein BS50DRAFT_591473 [Corynespora cassiicola Philippines]|uniref:Uncharacterized protein n=1 Tax=Corynespora cassiicola Philippines TaxID=1448308 RepID=A0A2T2NDK1_CORCC|nr:hypothetical protein BS50DRAFT_591473 [Corynespora cassiicola Philippines]